MSLRVAQLGQNLTH